MPMPVLMVASEIYPLLKTGGLADVVGALPAALHGAGCEARVLLPAFPALRAALAEVRPVAPLALPWGGEARLIEGRLPEVDGGDGALRAYLLDAPALFDRPGNPYDDGARQPYADNHRRFAALGLAGAALGAGLDPRWRPRVLHGHDWHAGLMPAYVRAAGTRVACVHTIHNLAYQGLFDAASLAELGLPAWTYQVDGLEFWGRISYMKAGIAYADRITTVSPGYSREVQTPEQGHGLDGLLRARRDHLVGILNGLDPAVWSPATDPMLPQRFGPRRMSGKTACKAALQLEAGLQPNPAAPLAIVVSRLAEQKGLALLLDALADLVDGGGQLMVLGSGDAELERAFSQAARAHPGRVAVRLGYDEALAHRMFGGGDLVLVPSRFEPCGLTQLYGLAYGCLPLVRAVGGLADTVVDTDLATLDDGSATGFAFRDFDAAALRHALRRAFALYRRPRDWARVRRAAMQQSFSWSGPARRYRALYDDVAASA